MFHTDTRYHANCEKKKKGGDKSKKNTEKNPVENDDPEWEDIADRKRDTSENRKDWKMDQRRERKKSEYGSDQEERHGESGRHKKEERHGRKNDREREELEKRKQCHTPHRRPRGKGATEDGAAQRYVKTTSSSSSRRRRSTSRQVKKVAHTALAGTERSMSEKEHSRLDKNGKNIRINRTRPEEHHHRDSDDSRQVPRCNVHYVRETELIHWNKQTDGDKTFQETESMGINWAPTTASRSNHQIRLGNLQAISRHECQYQHPPNRPTANVATMTNTRNHMKINR